MRYGSLFSGYGGLDLAVEEVFGAKAAWHSEIEPAACKVLEHRWPGVPNLGNVAEVDWADVEPVEIMCGGFPCQDLSAAGKRAGLKPGTRSGLWAEFARGIKVLRPELVVIENVRGLLSREASHPAHELGFCPGCLGVEPERVVLRALGAVLGDLADLGFDAEWLGLPASDVGAPHPRFRIVILAWPSGRPPTHPAVNASGQAEAGWARADAGRRGDAPAAEPFGHGREGRAERDGEPDLGEIDGAQRDDVERLGMADWGDYGPAIQRWESVLGRVAPAPTIVGARGGPKLSPRFVEWMMGLPDGWVTTPELATITRMSVSTNEALKMLGNGVVPQQLAAGIRLLLERAEGE